VTWADVIRRTYFDGGVDEIISTRRLVHVVQAFSIFNDKLKSIEMCVNRFDDDTKKSFIELYTKVDSGVSADDIMSEGKKDELADIQTDSDDTEEDNVI
jgi:hypothetical protein